MKDTYFKTRRPFRKRQHRYDIGSPIGSWNLHDDNHFLTRLYEIGNGEQAEYYRYHMEDAVNAGKCSEAEFYAHVREIVADHIEAIRKESPFSRRHARNRTNLKHLRTFRDYLTSINTYDYHDPMDIIVTRHNTEIAYLKKEIEEKDGELEKLKAYETPYRVRITKGYLFAFIDIIHQLQELSVPDKGVRLLSASTESIWVKMICKYFQHGEEEIKMETIKSRFTADKENPGPKHRPIRDKDRIFRVERRVK